MKKLLSIALLTVALSALAADKKDGWISLFNGKDLGGWQASDAPGTFSVKDGQIVVHGPRSHLFYTGAVYGHTFKNFELKADVMTFPGANSGVYFHTAWQETGWPSKGYEVQVNNSHRDPKRTAGLYDIKDNMEAVAKDKEWFTLSITVEGKHIVTKVNGKTVVDYTEEEKPERTPQHSDRLISRGTFALQGHDPDSEVHFKNIMVKPLP